MAKTKAQLKGKWIHRKESMKPVPTAEAKHIISELIDSHWRRENELLRDQVRRLRRSVTVRDFSIRALNTNLQRANEQLAEAAVETRVRELDHVAVSNVLHTIFVEQPGLRYRFASTVAFVDLQEQDEREAAELFGSDSDTEVETVLDESEEQIE